MGPAEAESGQEEQPKMKRTWILLASRGGAKLFENKGPGSHPSWLQDLPFPKGRLKNSEIDTDRPGYAFDSAGQGKHSMDRQNDAKAQAAKEFAQQLSAMLRDGRVKRSYQNLVLVAEPAFLGELRAQLDKETAALVSNSVSKEIQDHPNHELEKMLKEMFFSF